MRERRDTPEVDPSETLGVTSTLLWLQVGAIGLSLNHILLDLSIVLFGPTAEVGALAGVLTIVVALIYVVWAMSLARAAQGRADALPSLLVYAAVWAMLGNGGTIVFCPPPCAGAVPFGEIAHVGSLVFGGLAAYVTVKAIRATTQKIAWWRAAPDLVLIVATFYLLNLLFDG